MKILQIISSGTVDGGAERIVESSSKIFRKKDHTVKILTAKSNLGQKSFSNFTFERIPNSGIKKYIYSAFNLSAYIETKKILIKYNPDVVLLHTMMQPTAAVLFLLKKYPTILFVHGPEVFTKALLPWHLPLNRYKKRNYELKDLTSLGIISYVFNRFICGLFYKISINNINKVIALSKFTKILLEKEGFKNVIYIPNGTILFKNKLPNYNKLKLLYAGRMEQFKGIHILIKAMPQILDKYPTSSLTLVGEGSYLNNLKKIVKNLNLEKYIQFKNRKNSIDLELEYHKSTIFVLPSTWPETFGLAGVEAMSTGRPVVGSNIGGIPEWLIDGKNGFLTNPGDINDLADKIIKLHSNNKLYKNMSKNAAVYAKKYSIDNFSQNIENIMHELVYNLKKEKDL